MRPSILFSETSYFVIASAAWFSARVVGVDSARVGSVGPDNGVERLIAIAPVFASSVATSGVPATSRLIASATDFDAATYDVVVSNVVGSLASNKAVVTLNAAVSITQQPAGISLNPGSMTTLTVSASGTAPLTYQWSKDGSPIPGASAASLVLSNAQALDSGTYAVVVGNVVGSVSSTPAEVFINAPVTISAQPEGVQLTAGSSALLSVTASGTAPLTYQWFKNGAALAGANTSTFAIASAQAGDAATYEVAVSNIVGTVSSAKAVVALNVPVSITTQPANFTSVVGSSMALSASYSASARPGGKALSAYVTSS